MKNFKEKMKRLVSVLLVIAMLIATNGMSTLASSIKYEEADDEIVEEFDDKYYSEYKEEISSSKDVENDIDEDIVYDELEEEPEDTSKEEPEEDISKDTDEVYNEESSKKYEGSETNTLPNDLIYDVEDEIEEDEDSNVYTTGNDKKKEEETNETEEKIDEVENKENAALYGKIKIKEVLIKNNENVFDSDAWITTRDDADYYLSPISDVVIEDENKNKKIVQVAIKWVEDFDREEVKNIMDKEKKHDFKLKYKIDKNELKNEIKKAIENNEAYDYESRKTLNAFMDEEMSGVLRKEIRNVGVSELGEEGKLGENGIDEDLKEEDTVNYGKEGSEEDIDIESLKNKVKKLLGYDLNMSDEELLEKLEEKYGEGINENDNTTFTENNGDLENEEEPYEEEAENDENENLAAKNDSTTFTGNNDEIENIDEVRYGVAVNNSNNENLAAKNDNTTFTGNNDKIENIDEVRYGEAVNNSNNKNLAAKNDSTTFAGNNDKIENIDEVRYGEAVNNSNNENLGAKNDNTTFAGNNDEIENIDEVRVRYGEAVNNSNNENLENEEEPQEEEKPYTIEDAEKNLTNFIRNKNTLKKAIELEKDSYINDYAKMADDVIEEEEVFYGSENGESKDEIVFDEEYDEIEAEMNVNYYAGDHTHAVCGAAFTTEQLEGIRRRAENENSFMKRLLEDIYRIGKTNTCMHTLFGHSYNTSSTNKYSKLKESSKIRGYGGYYFLDRDYDFINAFGTGNFYNGINIYLCMNGHPFGTNKKKGFGLYCNTKNNGSRLVITNCSQEKEVQITSAGSRNCITNFQYTEIYGHKKCIDIITKQVSAQFCDCNTSNYAPFEGINTSAYNVRIGDASIYSDNIYLEKVRIYNPRPKVFYHTIRGNKVDIRDIYARYVNFELIGDDIHLYGENIFDSLYGHSKDRKASSGVTVIEVRNSLSVVNSVTSIGYNRYWNSLIGIYLKPNAKMTIENSSLQMSYVYEALYVGEGAVIYDKGNNKIEQKMNGNEYRNSRLYSENREGFIIPIGNPTGTWNAPVEFSGDGTGIIYKDWTKTKVTNKFTSYNKKYQVMLRGNDIVINRNAYTIKFNKGQVPTGAEIKGSIGDLTPVVGTKVKMPDSYYTVEGYDQIGWTTTKDSTTVMYEKDKEYNGLTNTRGATVELYAVWKQQRHSHRACGIDISKSCSHEGISSDEHRQEIVYEGISNNTVTMSSGAYYLERNITYNKLVTVNNTLNICLNGHNLSGINFTGRGKVNICNCVNNNATVTQFNGQYMFNGVKGGIYSVGGRTTVKTRGVANSETLNLLNVDLVPNETTALETSIINVTGSMSVNNVTIKGYKTSNTFMTVGGQFNAYSQVEISGNKQTGVNANKRGFVNIEGAASFGSGTISIKNNEIDKLRGTSDQYVVNIGDSKKWTVKSNVEITGNKFLNSTAENNNLMALRVGSGGVIDISSNKINVSGNTVNGGYNIYQVYSYNSDGFINQASGKFVTSGSKMEVGFSRADGTGYIYKTWTSNTVDNVNKYSEVFTASKIKDKELIIQYKDNNVRVWFNHYHKACGAEGECNHKGYAAHTESVKYVEYNDSNNGYYYLTDNLENKTITVNEMLDICLNGHKMINVEFIGNGAVYVTTCKGENDKEEIDNVRFTGSRISGYIGGRGRIVYKVSNSIKTTGQGIFSLNNVKLVKGVDSGIENIINTTGEVLLQEVEVNGINLTGNIIKSTRDIKVYGDNKITGNKLSKGSMIELSENNLMLEEGSKLVIDNNEITKEDAQVEQGIIKIGNGHKLELKGNIEITNNKYKGVNREEGGPIERGLISSVIVEETGKIAIGNSYIKIKGNTSEGEGVSNSLHLSDIYSKNKEGFLEQIENTKIKLNEVEIRVLFTTPYVGTIYKGFSSSKVEGDINKFADRFLVDKMAGEGLAVKIVEGDLVIGYDGVYIIEYNIGQPVAHDTSISYDMGGTTKGHTAPIDQNTKLEENNFYVEGFTFIGWSRTIDGSDEDIAKEEHEPYTTELGKVVTLYAIWKQNTYTIRYIGGAGVTKSGESKAASGNISQQTAYCREKVTLRTNEQGFLLEGFKLIGFKLGDKIYGAGDTVDSLIDKDGEIVILEATWEEKKYTVTFDKGGDGTFDIIGEDKEDKEYYYYDKIDMTNPYSAESKVFENWKLVSIKKDGEEAEDGNRGRIGTLYAVGNDNFGLTETEGAVVYMEGVWGNKPYDIVYKKGSPVDSKGVSHESEVKGNVPSQKGKMTELVKLRTNEEGFSVEGFEFIGWSLDPNGLGDVYKETVDEEGNRVGAEVTTINDEEKELVNLYAIWEEVTYKIHFSSGIAGVDDLEMAELENVHYFDVDNETDKLPKHTYAVNDRVFSRWKITSIEGGVTEDTVNINRELKSTSVRGKLTTSNKSVVTLTASWISRAEAHTHKVCGVSNGEACLHIGESHSDDDTVYEMLDEVDEATIDTMIANGGYYYLVDNLEVNREIELGRGIVLHICLNGRKLIGARFKGQGEVYITNCVTEESMNEASIVEEGSGNAVNIFDTVTANVLGKGKIKVEAANGINGLFYDVAKTEVYNVEIKGKYNYIAEWRSSVDENIFDKVEIRDVEIKGYMFEDGKASIKDITIDNVKSDTYLFYNVVLTARGENEISNNEVKAAIMELRGLTVEENGKIKVVDNEASKGAGEDSEIEIGLINSVSLNLGENGEIEAVGNSTVKKVLYVSGDMSVGEGSKIKLNNNKVKVTEGNAKENYVLSFGRNKQISMLGSIEVKNNEFSGGYSASGYYVPVGSVLNVGNGYIDVSGNSLEGDSKTSSYHMTQVLSSSTDAFLRATSTDYKFDAENSNMTIAFDVSTMRGTIFENFSSEYVKDYTEDLHKTVFKADTAYHNNLLLKVDVVDTGELARYIIITPGEGYRINYKKGRALKENRGTVEIEGEEFSVDIDGRSLEEIAKNPFKANGFTFAGWTTVEYGKYGTEEYKEGDILPDFSSSKVRLGERDEVNLYAVWRENTYNIVYESGTEAIESTMASEEVNYYSAKELTYSEYDRTGYEPNKWEVVSIKDKNGNNIEGKVKVGTVFDMTEEVRELVNSDGGVITLKVVWIEVTLPEEHMHKICGTPNSMSCNHQGLTAHDNDETVYTPWRSTTVNSGVYDGAGYYYLGNNISVNRTINVNGKLVICLNGHTLSNVRFRGSENDEVIITNCKTSNSGIITNATTTAHMFDGLNVGIYGRGQTTVKSNIAIIGDSVNVTTLRVMFVPYNKDEEIRESVISIANGSLKLISSVMREYNVEGSLLLLNNTNGEARDTRIGEDSGVIKANAILSMMNGTNMTFDKLSIKYTEVDRILMIEGGSRVTLASDNWIMNNVVRDKVVALDSTSLVEAGSSNLIISENEGASEIVTIEEGGEWDIQALAGVYIDDNILTKVAQDQAVVNVKGNIYLAGALNIQGNRLLDGPSSGVAAGLLISESSNIYVGQGNMVVKNNVSRSDNNYMYQVYSNNKEGFIKQIAGTKIKANETEIKVAFPSPYRGTIYEDWSSNTVENFEVANSNLDKIFVADTKNDNRLVTYITNKEGKDNVVIGLEGTEFLYKVRYNKGVATDLYSSEHIITGDSYTTDEKLGSTMVLDNGERFSATGFTLTGWKNEKTKGTYSKEGEVSISDFVEDDGETIEFTAVWTENKYYINYVAPNEAGVSGESMPRGTYRYYETKELEESTYSKENQYPSGWVVTKVEDKDRKEITNSSLLGRSFSNKETISGLTAEDGVTITLTAVFSDVVVTFDYEIEGAVAKNGTRYNPEYINKPEQKIVKSGEVTFTSEGVEFTGFHMIGYKDSSNKQYQLDTPYKVNEFTANSEGIVTMTPIWQENIYYIYYLATGSQVKGESMGYDTFSYYEKNELTKNTYTKMGCSFLAWQVLEVLDYDGQEIDINSLSKKSFTDEEPIERVVKEDKARVYLAPTFENNHKHKLCGAGINEPCPHRGTHDIDVFEAWDGSFTITEGKYFVYTESEDGVAYYDGPDMVLTGDLIICLNGNKMILTNGKIMKPEGTSYNVTLTNCALGTATTIQEAELDPATGILAGEGEGGLFNEMLVNVFTYRTWILIEGVNTAMKLMVGLNGKQFAINGEVYDPNVSNRRRYGQETNNNGKPKELYEIDEEIEEVFDEDENDKELKTNLQDISSLIDKLK